MVLIINSFFLIINYFLEKKIFGKKNFGKKTCNLKTQLNSSFKFDIYETGRPANTGRPAMDRQTGIYRLPAGLKSVPVPDRPVAGTGSIYALGCSQIFQSLLLFQNFSGQKLTIFALFRKI